MELDGNINQKSGYKGLYSYSFPIIYRLDNKKIKVGESVIYSSRSVVFNKVKLGFMFIVVNTIIRTFVLGFLIVWLSGRILSRPLSQMTAAVEGITMDRLDDFQVNLNIKSPNELTVLEESFNTMAKELNKYHGNLQELVEKKTKDLRIILKIQFQHPPRRQHVLHCCLHRICHN